MQLPAIRAARRLGLRVIVADGNPQAAGRDEADEFEHVDLKDKEGMLAMARDKAAHGGLAGVFTAGTDFSETVSYVTEGLGLPGTSYESARNATDKFVMRSRLAEAGVPVPLYFVVTERDLYRPDFANRVAEIGLPVVVKPVDNMGARGVVRADSAEDAHACALSSLPFSRSGRVLIEGYIDGPEFSLDALVFDGAVLHTGFADRHICFPPRFVEMGHTIPTCIDKKQQSIVKSVFEAGIHALGISHGAAKGDIKLSSDGPVVGEIAARLSGGFMSGWTFPLSSGVALTEKAIRIAMGTAPGSVEPVWSRTSAERAVISIPGTIESIVGLGDARKLPDIAEVFGMRGPGDRMRFPENNVDKVANVIAVAELREDAIRSAEQAVASIEVVLEQGDEDTEAFLFGARPGHVAFPTIDSVLDGADTGDMLGRRTDRRPVRVESIGAPPRFLTSSELDWSYRTPARCVEMLDIADLIGRDPVDEKATNLFWAALARGGLQGGRYALRLLGVA